MATETRPLLTVLRIHLLATSTDCPAASDGGQRLTIALPWLCSSCRFATFWAHHRPLLIDRSHVAIGPGIEDQSDRSQIAGGGEKGEGERGNRHIIVGRPPIAPPLRAPAGDPTPITPAPVKDMYSSEIFDRDQGIASLDPAM